jgi:hypothetical protein
MHELALLILVDLRFLKFESKFVMKSLRLGNKQGTTKSKLQSKKLGTSQNLDGAFLQESLF